MASLWIYFGLVWLAIKGFWICRTIFQVEAGFEALCKSVLMAPFDEIDIFSHPKIVVRTVTNDQKLPNYDHLKCRHFDFSSSYLCFVMTFRFLNNESIDADCNTLVQLFLEQFTTHERKRGHYPHSNYFFCISRCFYLVRGFLKSSTEVAISNDFLLQQCPTQRCC